MNPKVVKKVVKKVKEKKKQIVDRMKKNSKEGKGLLGFDKKDTSGPGMSMPSTPSLSKTPSYGTGRSDVDPSQSKPSTPINYMDAPYAPSYGKPGQVNNRRSI